jgi:hypothetical protein
MGTGVRRATARGVVLGLVTTVSLVGCGVKAGTSPGPDQLADGAPAAPTPAEAGKLSPADLQGRWWSWAATESWETNPVADDDGRDCGRNQPEDVWFLAGTFGGHAERMCTVPAGRPIALPVVNMLGGAEDCGAFMAYAEGTMKLDGAEVDMDRYAYTNVTVTASAGNPLTTEGGTFPSGACGLWAQLPPLEPGEHSLRLAGSSGDFSVSVVYSLTAEGAPKA